MGNNCRASETGKGGPKAALTSIRMAGEIRQGYAASV